MRKIMLLAVVLALVMLSVSAVVAHEGDVHECHWDSGQAFGVHAADHAQTGHLGAEHHPGMHDGYSLCVP